ncbi:uncharacterized protein LOC131664557 [Phymastichus coffea]|uniref:uncharacterized protein LOC131664557 n=1 Tax=Phymastichus coffea TaxID=108790 RepID=UPI00273AE435|nr:uncharacterized protein LOC131664557 [Phymastichus coffea]
MDSQIDGPLIALRNKYAEDLEDILTCPVCFERLTKKIPVCTQGHHICEQCSPRMACCPVCKENFNGTRNFLAESLIIKFDEIKDSLIDPQHSLNRKVLEGRVSVSTQTENLFKNDGINNNNVLITNCSNIAINNWLKGPVVGKGKYPCRIGDCTEELPHGRMIPHLRYYHKENIVEEKMVTNAMYEYKWEIQYEFGMKNDKVISIPNMGLFFWNVTIDIEGNLRGSLQIANTTLVSQQFTYEMTIIHSHSSVSYKGNVLSCRSPQTKLVDKSLFIINSFMKTMLKRRKAFTCTIVITHHPESSNILKRENNEISLSSI